MIKLLIADDEIGIRRGLKHYIDWSAWGIELIGVVSDGQEALGKCLETQPDILLTDIRMPKLDGLELCKELKKQFPLLEIAVLSGYNDTEYLREAISLGVKEYLLKPAGIQDIVQTVLKLRDTTISKKDDQQFARTRESLLEENLPVIQLHFLNNLVNNKFNNPEIIGNKARILQIPISGPLFKVLIMRMVLLESYEYKGQHEKDLEQWQIIQIIEKLAAALPNIFIGEIEPQHYIVLINSDDYSYLDNLTSEISMNLISSFESKNEKKIIIGVGISVDNIMNIPSSYACAKKSLTHFAWEKNKNVFYPSTNDSVIENECLTKINYIENEIALYITKNDSENIIRLLIDMFVNYHTIFADFDLVKDSCKRIITLINQTLLVRKSCSECIEISTYFQIIDSADSATDLKNWMVKQIQKLLNPYDIKTQHSTLIKKALCYIEKHYTEDLTLQFLAKELFISPNYLGKLFTEETGYRLHEWVNKFRIEKSMELLENPDLKISNIAHMVGYSSYKYFSIHFFKYAGCCARDYRNNSITT